GGGGIAGLPQECEARRVEARWWAVWLRWPRRTPMRRADLPRVPPYRPLCAGRARDGRQHLVEVRPAQSVRGGDRIWRERHESGSRTGPPIAVTYSRSNRA